MIDIIIPVFEGAHETRRCIESVLASSSPDAVEIVVVDDATPNKAIAAHLGDLVAARKVTLLRNASNEGFVRSVNRGMALHEDRDVILLNSDTEVANDWVGRMRAAADSAQNTATVTPFSNNATICSYPHDGWAGRVPGTLGLAGLDRLFAEANGGKVVDLPTAVGFCMFVRRDCVRRIGPFDADRFGRGYGEENDFCRRAAKAGWRNVLACDVFVFHEGSVSFAGERQALMEAAAKALIAAHPEYGQVVQAFIVADPMLPMRQAIDVARARVGGDEALAVVAERAGERAAIMARLRDRERAFAEREALIGRLEAGLAEATELVAARTVDEQTREHQLYHRDQEIDRLHAGLSNAEALAFSRERELLRIQSFWLWKYFSFLMRKTEPTKQAGS